MPTQKLTTEIVTAAIEGFEQQKLRIDAQIAELRTMLPGGRTEPAATLETPKGKRRKLSAAARKRMGEAQRKRWAVAKSGAQTASEATALPKRKLSAAGRAAIVAALKKRWAAKKAGLYVAKRPIGGKAAPRKAVVKTAANARAG